MKDKARKKVETKLKPVLKEFGIVGVTQLRYYDVAYHNAVMEYLVRLKNKAVMEKNKGSVIKVLQTVWELRRGYEYYRTLPKPRGKMKVKVRWCMYLVALDRSMYKWRTKQREIDD